MSEPTTDVLVAGLRLSVVTLEQEIAAADRLERLQAQVDAVREACDRIVLPWQETGEPTGEHLRDAAAMIRAALDGDDDAA